MLTADAPATPSAEEARQAAQHELQKTIYQEQPSLLQLIFDWLEKHLGPESLVPVVPAWVSYLIVLIITIVLIVAIIRLSTRITLARRRRQSSALFEDERDALSLTKSANDAAKQGDFATAVVERFRAIIRSLDERALLDEYPGMTAHEAAVLGSTALPDLRDNFGYAGNLFDVVRYGEIPSTADQDAWMRQFAEQVTNTAAPKANKSVAPNSLEAVL